MQLVGVLPISGIDSIRRKLLEMARGYETVVILDSNSPHFSASGSLHPKYSLLAGFTNNLREGKMMTSFEKLEKINSRTRKWYLGYLSYDLKNELEDLKSGHPDELCWPTVMFFEPEVLFAADEENLSVYAESSETSFEDIGKIFTLPDSQSECRILLPRMHSRVSKEDYLQNVARIKSHIARGDIYELNYCIEFYNYASIDPFLTYLDFCRYSPSPFAAFVRHRQNYLISASPERFLRKEDDLILSQPIKGTAPRSKDKAIDRENKLLLETSLKERTENIMITDLVRNDLSKVARSKTVQVNELCSIYPFPQVYQMISTVSARLDNKNFAEIIRATFPMGSMTGAPKIRAMQLIEEYETTKRGLYSGAVGYISPGMDFDLNVVIRSLQYKADTKYLSYLAGSAITDQSVPEKEYDECILKAYTINPDSKEDQHA